MPGADATAAAVRRAGWTAEACLAWATLGPPGKLALDFPRGHRVLSR